MFYIIIDNEVYKTCLVLTIQFPNGFLSFRSLCYVLVLAQYDAATYGNARLWYHYSTMDD